MKLTLFVLFIVVLFDIREPGIDVEEKFDSLDSFFPVFLRLLFFQHDLSCIEGFKRIRSPSTPSLLKVATDKSQEERFHEKKMTPDSSFGQKERKRQENSLNE